MTTSVLESAQTTLQSNALSKGLSDAEVAQRVARGEINKAPAGTGRSYLEIIRQNVFTFINTILFAIGIVLVVMGRPDDAIVTAGLVFVNVIVGVFQEARAKAKLDKIALLTRPKATVVRNGAEKVIDPSEIVLDDVLVVKPGDQIVVDGEVIGTGEMDADESLLTGESDLIHKKTGDPVYSGSFAVNGTAHYVARKVGAASVANQLTSGARAFRVVKTPLQRDVDFVIRVLIVLVTLLGLLLVSAFLRQGVGMVSGVQASAVIVGLVPQGLFFMITVAYAVGAVRMSGRGALIQQSNAVESLSNVNTLCLDKTGTLTTNAIKYNSVHPLGMDKETLERVLGDYALNTPAGNKTSEAIGTALNGAKRKLVGEVPFSSARKWSALAFDEDACRGCYVLGAPEMLMPALQAGVDLAPEKQEEWRAQGLRVLLFAYVPDVQSMQDDKKEAALPKGLIPAGLVCFSDELRPEARQTLEGFSQAGIRLKVISGDNPDTVMSLAKQAGFGEDIKMVSGLDLDKMDEAEFGRVADETTIFGRITPQQKQKLVQTLKGSGRYVAMIGDGVNDVLSLKQAHVGIAMQSGSQATRGVADLILLNDSFGVLPSAFKEGQRIINGMYDVVRLLLTRTLYLLFLIVGTSMMALEFPITPKHNSLLAILTVGIPTVALVAWAREGEPPARLIRAISHFVLPASILTAFAGLEVYLGYMVATDNNVQLSQTVLTTVLTLCGLILVPFVEPPTEGWVGGDEYSGDKKPTILAGIMLAIFVIVMAIEPLRRFFELEALNLVDIGVVLGVVIVWAFALRFIWRARIMERLIGT